jgi:hypothetical protein
MIVLKLGQTIKKGVANSNKNKNNSDSWPVDNEGFPVSIKRTIIDPKGFGNSISECMKIIRDLERSESYVDNQYRQSNEFKKHLENWAIIIANGQQSSELAKEFVSKLPDKYFDTNQLIKKVLKVMW